jgi:RNA polymerase-binding transcription factor DksA
MKANELDGYRKSLLEEKKRLSAALELASLEEHLAEVGSVTLEREIDYSLEEVAQVGLTAIDSALERIEQGSFGRCASCARPIAAERLAALPWASLCIDCKRHEERG